MLETKCTIALSDLIDIAEQDSKRQIAEGQRIKPDKFTASKYAQLVGDAFPDVKASHFRTARFNAKKIREGSTEYVTTPCFTLRAFVTYLMTVEGDKDWTGVKTYINNNAPELKSLLLADTTEVDVTPISNFMSQPVKDWEPSEGGIGDHMIRVGHYVKQLEMKSKKTITELISKQKEVKNLREADQTEYKALLSEMYEILSEMQKMQGTGNPRSEKQLAVSIERIKQKIDFYKKS